MLIGIDWGGTKIEGIAMSEEATEILRLREVTPRGDYHGCIGIIVDLVARLERETGQAGSLGIGSWFEPRTRLGKGASSTWLLGEPVEKATCSKRWGVPSALRTMPIAWRPPKPRDGAGAGFNVVFAVILGERYRGRRRCCWSRASWAQQQCGRMGAQPPAHAAPQRDSPVGHATAEVRLPRNLWLGSGLRGRVREALG